MSSPNADATSSGSATRASHLLHERSADAATLAELLSSGLERIDLALDAVQLLVVTLDAEVALAVTDASYRVAPTRPVLPVTSVKRAVRLLEQPRHAVAGAVADITELMKRSALKLDSVKTVVIVGADHLAEMGSIVELDAILAELPKDAARVVQAEKMTDAVKSLAERHLHKARTMTAPAPTTVSLETVHFVTAAPSARPAMLRRLFDELDPPSAAIVAADPTAAREAIARLGYGERDAVVVGSADAVGENSALVVLWDLPSARQLTLVAAKAPVRIVALVAPRDVAALRLAITGATLVPLVPKDATRTVRAADSRLRADLRTELAGGSALRELLALEPLFDEYDPAEVAAAAVRLLEKEKSRAVSAAIAAAVAGAASLPQRDPVRHEPRAEARTEIADAEAPAPRGGDRSPQRSERSDSERGERTPRGSFGDRPPRSDRSERGERSDRGDRDRGPRSSSGPRGFGARSDRPTRGGSDRPARGPGGPRGERPSSDRPARPYGDRPARPSGDRPARPFGDRPARPAGAGRDDAPRKYGPKGFGTGRPARGPEEGGARGEWKERGERLKHSKRPRKD